MHCPFEISEIIAGILEIGLLRIRSLGWSGQAGRCAIEADHIHNLPDLLADYSQDRLTYYWGIERQAYIARNPDDPLTEWESLWRRLQPYAESAMNAPAPAR